MAYSGEDVQFLGLDSGAPQREIEVRQSFGDFGTVFAAAEQERGRIVFRNFQIQGQSRIDEGLKCGPRTFTFDGIGCAFVS